MKWARATVYFAAIAGLGQCSRHSQSDNCGSASVYIHRPETDIHQQQQQYRSGQDDDNVPQLSVQDTQLVLEQLAGVDHESRLQDGYQAARIGQILQSSGTTTTATKDSSKSQDAPVIIVIDNMEDMAKDMFCTFKMDRSPSSEYYLDLFRSLENGHNQNSQIEVEVDGEDNNDGLEHLEKLSRDQTLTSKMVHVRTLSKYHNNNKDNNEDYGVEARRIARLVEQTIETHSTSPVVVISLSPNTCHCGGSGHSKKNMMARTHGHRVSKRDDLIVSTKKNKKVSTGPFSSQEQCEELTNGCSGHGSCVPVSKAQKTQFHCVCSSTFNDDKKQTTYWAGSSCEKIDVSVPTQMFLWTGIGTVLVIAAAIKLMFSINSEPLPGILDLGKRE